MEFQTRYIKGDVISNDDMKNEFRCSNMGGMRRSKKTNTLVLVMDHTKGLYDDKWKDGILYYTGMGKYGDQELKGQNKTLAQYFLHDIQVHLFEVYKPKKYTYKGRVKLAGKPFQEIQEDEAGRDRKVWIFPLKVIEDI